MEYTGKLSIHRATSNMVESLPVEIELTDAGNGSRVGTIQIEPEAFLMAIMGRGYVDCAFEMDTKNVGKTLEHMTAEVLIPDGVYKREEVRRLANLQTALHQQEGWSPRLEDAGNGHKVVRRSAGGTIYAVSLTRYV